MDTDARDAARHYYSCSSRCLSADVAALAQNSRGLLIWSPRLVALAKPVLLSRPEEWGRLEHSPDAADAWYVHLLTGDMQSARRVAAETPPLRWLCFQRGARSPRVHVVLWRSFLSH